MLQYIVPDLFFWVGHGGTIKKSPMNEANAMNNSLFIAYQDCVISICTLNISRMQACLKNLLDAVVTGLDV